jgi:putative tryptophan/tyrosine transport system substrate-binding protein
MKRREFVAGVISIAAASGSAAQTAGARQRLAIFSPSEPAGAMHEDKEYRVFFNELRRLGRVEGQNLIVDRYGEEQNTTDLAALAAKVISSGPDIIFVVGPGAIFFKSPITTIPIVTVTGNPVGLGLASSLAHPGGNITGASVDAGPSIHGKRIELLREIHPAMSKLGVLLLRVQMTQYADAAMRAAAADAGISVIYSLIDLPSSEPIYRSAIAQALRDGADAIMVLDSPDTVKNSTTIVRLVGTVKVPAVYTFPQFVEAGGLLAYSYDLAELNKRAANDIDAILRGAKAGDIPFYQASKFELSINLKTAKDLNLPVPPTLLVRADRVIE